MTGRPGDMASYRDRQLQALKRRFDRDALDQLRAEVARLAAENDRLRNEVIYFEDLAESWRGDAIEFQIALCKRNGSSPGIDVDGHLRVVAG